MQNKRCKPVKTSFVGNAEITGVAYPGAAREFRPGHRNLLRRQVRFAQENPRFPTSRGQKAVS